MTGNELGLTYRREGNDAWPEIDPESFTAVFNRVAADPHQGRRELQRLLSLFGPRDDMEKKVFVEGFVHEAVRRRDFSVLAHFTDDVLYDRKLETGWCIGLALMRGLGRADGFAQELS